MAPEPDAVGPKKFSGLPVQIVSPADVSRLIREVETIDDALHQLSLRAPGTEVKMPKTSKLLDQTAELNKLNLLEKSDRELLNRTLQLIKERAPVLHISFSADPSAAFLEKLMVWLRREIHPLVLLTIGLQPNMGAGCIVRTKNRQFDFSLKQDFAGKRDLLMGKLRAPETSA